MIGRHLIRIKVLQTLYAYKRTENPEFENFNKELEFSLKKSYEQYLMFLLILVEIRRYAEMRIGQIKERQIKNDAAWQRIQRLADNRVLLQLENNAQLQKIIEHEKISLVNYQIPFKKIFNTIIDSETESYNDYIASEDTYKNDNNFVRVILQNIIAESELLADTFEDNSIFWNDDVDSVISMVEKTIKSFSEKNPEGGEILPMFADADTHDFGFMLFIKTLNSWDELTPYIQKNLKNWELERVAEMDIIIMHLALTEMIVFKEIPIPVSMNEYVELAKWYSTQNSGKFVNGVLHKVSEELKSEGKIKKVGRGLIEKL
ncbi:MAG: transcription antitermination factor NusB [Bacteroidales bacterium]|nr:transcription antitermination factor NusB [Bacteroidales bacterium]